MDTKKHQINKENDSPEVTVAVISFNGRKIIKSCFDSIFAQNYKKMRVYLIDNASTDGTPKWVKKNYPKVEVFNYPKNKGPNPARNLAIKESYHELVLLVDDDAVLEKNCLQELIKAVNFHPDGAVWVPRIIYYNTPNVIQFEGTYLHYLTEAILLNGDISLKEGMKEITPIQMAAGVCLLVSKKAAMSIDLFDEDYFFGRTDGEFTFRLTLSGQTLYSVPNAYCYHKVKERGLKKVYYQVRNRWYLMLTTYSIKTLILIIPVLIIYELALICFLLIKNKIIEYVKAIYSVLVMLPTICKKRRKIQSYKRVPDKQILHGGSINVRKDLIENRVIAFIKKSLDNIFNFYWNFINQFI